MTRGSTGPALTGLKPHLLACSRLHVSPGEHSQALTRVHLCSGTIVISEPSYRIFLHKLVLDPEPQLHRTADLQGPEPRSEGKQDHYVFVAWAPDGSAGILQYNITDDEDERGLEFSEDSCFEVSCAAATPSLCSCPWDHVCRQSTAAKSACTYHLIVLAAP